MQVVILPDLLVFISCTLPYPSLIIHFEKVWMTGDFYLIIL